MAKVLRRDEEKVQKAVLEALGYLYPEGIVFHIPNQRGTKIMRMILSGLGVKAGMPDLGILRPYGRIGWMECKAPGGTLTDSQTKLHPQMEAMWHTVHCVSTVDHVQPITRTWRQEDAATRKALDQEDRACA